MRRAAPSALLLAAALCGTAAALRTVAAPGAADAPRRPKKERRPAKRKDLAFMHVPYNFGHTVEMAALLPILPPNMQGGYHGGFSSKFVTQNMSRSLVTISKLMRPDAVVWGHFDPELNVVSEATGCPMYYTPPKYWPEALAKKYFGNKTVFGILRDPYERLTAFFRGGFSSYGGDYPEFFKTCDVNNAVKMMLKDAIANKNPFHSSCTFLPQAEYFDGEYGISLPIDNRRFPSMANKALKEHGYNFKIRTEHIAHVRGCDNSWAGDLDAETKSLVKQVYKRDFELLCKYFNYCDNDELTCLPEVPYMCPLNHFKWDKKAKIYRRMENQTVKS